MNSLKSLIWLLPLALGLIACGSDDDDSPSQEVNVRISTGDVQNVTLTSAALQGTVSSPASSYTEVGIACCLENNSEAMTYTKVTNMLSGTGIRNFIVTLTGLQPDATYTYGTYVKDKNGNIVNANDRKTFRTKSPVEVLQSAVMRYIAISDATIYLNITDSTLYSELTDQKFNASFGFAWSKEKGDLTPVDNRFNTHTQPLVFDKEGHVYAKCTSLIPSTQYYYVTYVNLDEKLYVAPVSSFTTLSPNVIKGNAPDGVQIVDLGLPSGTKWASMNVGAQKAEDSGLYYAWGETSGYMPFKKEGDTIKVFKNSFEWSEYVWCKKSRESITKYCTNSSFGTVDGKVLLDLDDDAAYLNWGDEWRMPTVEEVKELFDYTKSEWTTVGGVIGCKFTSTTTGNSIFLPTAGCGVGNSNYDEGQNCYYWTASVDQKNPYSSRYLGFQIKTFIASLPRYYGMNVRPVLRK